MSKFERMKRSLKQAAVGLLTASWMAWSALSPAAAGETRQISLYQVHTKETLTVTYKKNGRYIPSAMKKLNHILRDWRRNATTRMDPKTIDLMWELHADLGSKKPIHIISGYRSAKTNAMLKRIGRGVARRSRHIKGQAIDMYFPDVPTSRVRNSALVRKIGGVGYYPRSGKSGFVHIDSGNVRHWPRVSKARMAKIFRDYKKTVGARRYRKQQPVMMAAFHTPKAKKQQGPVSIMPKGLNSKTAVARNRNVPKPRTRPVEVVMLAAAISPDIQVVPASAPVPTQNFSQTVTRIRDMETLVTASTSALNQHSNIAAKGSLTKEILNGTASNTPTIRPLLTATQQAEDDDDSWWPFQFLASSADSLFRRDGAPQPFAKPDNDPTIISASENARLQQMIASLAPENQIDVKTLERPATTQISVTSGKSDKLRVNRSGKTDLLQNAPANMLKRQSSLNTDLRAEAILRSIEKPISFE